MSPPAHKGIGAQYDEEELGKIFDLRLVKRLHHYLRPYRWLIVIAIGLAIFAALFRIVGPLLARHIINNFIPPDSPAQKEGLTTYSLLYMGVLIILLVANFGLVYITAYVGQRSMYDLRKDIFRKLQKLSMRFFDRNPSGRLLTRCTSDVQALNEFLSQGVVFIFADVVLLVGILVAWFFFEARLALLLLFTGPLIGIAAYNFRIRARKAYRAVRVRLAALNAFLQENLAGVRTVQAFHREKGSMRRYANMNEGYKQAQVETVRQFARFFPLVELISTLAIVIVLGYGGYLLSKRGMQMSPGDFYLYFQYIAWFFMPIQELAEKYNIFQSAMASSERIFMLLDTEEEVQDPENPQKAGPLSDGVEFRHVWFAYNGSHGEQEKRSEEETEWILKDVSLRVSKGTTAALVGATGAGKSTVINLIARLYDVQKGQVLYDGVNVRNFSQASLRRRMAIVLQDVFLFSGTIADNIRLGNREISDEQVKQAARYVNAHHFIEKLPQGYQNEVLERGATLSTGQKQLLAFARAVAFDPDLLILDEATANIDTETESLIQDALDKLMQNRTCIVVAHRLSTIQKADKIIVFHHGKIHEEGRHQELLQKDGLYRKLYELQYKT